MLWLGCDKKYHLVVSLENIADVVRIHSYNNNPFREHQIFENKIGKMLLNKIIKLLSNKTAAKLDCQTTFKQNCC